MSRIGLDVKTARRKKSNGLYDSWVNVTRRARPQVPHKQADLSSATTTLTSNHKEFCLTYIQRRQMFNVSIRQGSCPKIYLASLSVSWAPRTHHHIITLFHSFSILLIRVPTYGATSTSNVSPCFNVTFGFLLNPTPAGVPVSISVPGLSVVPCDRKLMTFGISKIKSL